MKTIKIYNNAYEIPESWSDVTVKTFENILEVALKKDTYKTQLEFVISVISAVTNIPYSILLNVDATIINEIQQAISFSDTEVKPTHKKEYIIKGIKYIPIDNYNTLTMGEYIDAEMLIKDSEPHKLLTNMLPLLIRRSVNNKPERFNVEKYKQNVELFANNLKIEDVIHLRVFF